MPGMDTSTGMRNVSSQYREKLLNTLRNERDARAYRSLVDKVEDGNKYSIDLLGENFEYLNNQSKSAENRADQRIINFAAEDQARSNNVKSHQFVTDWNTKQWDDKITADRKSGLSGGGGYDEITWGQTLNKLSGTNSVDVRLATDAYNRRMKQERMPYEMDLKKQNSINQAQSSMKYAELNSNEQLSRLDARTKAQQMESSEYIAGLQAGSSERIAQTQAAAAERAALYQGLGSLALKQHNWQYWG